MITEREIVATLEMLRNENLDVRTVTLGISLFDCATSEVEEFAARARAKISRLAGSLVDVCDEVGLRYGIPVVNKRIAVSPIAVAACSLSAEQMHTVAKTLDDVARDLRIDFIGGFSGERLLPVAATTLFRITGPSQSSPCSSSQDRTGLSAPQ